MLCSGTSGRIALALVVLMVAAGPARAAILVYDGFGYTPAGSTLMGKSGASGFSTTWMTGGYNASFHDNYVLASGSLAFPGLATDGSRVSSGSLASIGGVTRYLASPMGAAGTTRYISFLIRPEGTLNGGVWNGFFGLDIGSAAGELFIGKPGSGDLTHYVMEDRGGTGQVPTAAPVVVNQTTLLVLKAQFFNGSDRFTLYVNPVPGAAEPAVAAATKLVDLISVNQMTLYSTGAFSIDELRIGETFSDVTPVAVPEPSSVAVLLVFGTAATMRRRRRNPN